MASAAVLMLTLTKGQIGITVREDDSFSVDSDPKGLIDEDAGTWEFVAAMGTRLYLSNKFEFALLVDWRLAIAKTGQRGDILATHQVGMGNFEVKGLA